jgi:hypothetical protein
MIRILSVLVETDQELSARKYFAPLANTPQCEFMHAVILSEAKDLSVLIAAEIPRCARNDRRFVPGSSRGRYHPGWVPGRVRTVKR